MRPSHIATALTCFTAGVTASAALRRLADRRLPATPAAIAADPAGSPPVLDRDAVVLPLARPALPLSASTQPAAPARSGDSGGRTKAGAPCAARAFRGRCHHHPMAA